MNITINIKTMATVFPINLDEYYKVACADSKDIINIHTTLEETNDVVLDYSELERNENQVVIAEKILTDKKWPIKRGDVIRFKFVDYRDDGYFFYDGKRVIPPEKIDGFGSIPSEFKIGAEFSVNYWDKCSKIFRNSTVGGLYYDVKSAIFVLFKTFECLGRRADVYKDKNTEYQIVAIDGADFDKFKETGRCCDWSYLILYSDNSLVRKLLDNIPDEKCLVCPRQSETFTEL